MQALLAFLVALPLGAIIRMVLGSAMVVLLPKVLNYVWLNHSDQILSWVTTYLGQMGFDYDGVVFEMVGLAGYLATKFRFVESLAVVIASTVAMFFMSFFRS